MQLATAVPVPPPPDAEPRRPSGGGHPSAARTWFDRLVDPVRWEPGHQRLAAQPVFASCTRSDIRQLARAGDECFVPAGTVLCRAGRIGYWLFVVTSGAVVLRGGEGDAGGGGGAGGVPVGGGAGGVTLRAGSHFGEVAIVGFGPQPVTAEVVEDATVFVLGRRYVLDLLHSMPGFREGLFPGVSEAGLRSLVRELRETGTAAWRALPRVAVADLLAGDGIEQLPLTLVAVPSRVARRPGDRSPFSVALLSGGAPVVATRSPVAVRPLDRRLVAGAVAALFAVLVVFAFTFHPDVVVVRPSQPIDVSGDVVVEVSSSAAAGAGVVALHAPRGRYILTAVDIEETTLAGLALAMVRGDDTLPRVEGSDAIDDSRAGRERYHQSQRLALDLVARRAGVDPATISVRFRDRGLVGPSAGLVYALVLADMADVVLVPDGRVIAATGELADDGTVRAVGFLTVKREVARRSGATVFVVPTVGGGARAPTSGTISVASLDEALAAVGRG